jgi:hypothetical protein
MSRKSGRQCADGIDKDRVDLFFFEITHESFMLQERKVAAEMQEKYLAEMRNQWTRRHRRGIVNWYLHGCSSFMALGR